MYFSTWTRAKQSGIGTDHSRSGTANVPISGSSPNVEEDHRLHRELGVGGLQQPLDHLQASATSGATRTPRPTTAACPAISASRRCDRPAARRATSITVFGGHTVNDR